MCQISQKWSRWPAPCIGHLTICFAGLHLPVTAKQADSLSSRRTGIFHRVIVLSLQ
jgi:hypothetical protein